MSEAVQARAFDPLFTTKRRAKGTGLGLPSAAGIVREAGGTISVWSKIGEGSCFIISRPVTELLAQAIARRAVREEGESVGNRRHIMVRRGQRLGAQLRQTDVGARRLSRHARAFGR
jgi:hypothetical protein